MVLELVASGNFAFSVGNVCEMINASCKPPIADRACHSHPSSCYRTGKRARTQAVSHLSLELSPCLASSIFDRGGELNESIPSTSGRSPSDVPYVQFPSRQQSEQGPGQKSPTVRVKLNVHYRVHSRQMLCIGGSQLPFGWSFLSIAKVPLAWRPGDVWTTEVELPVGTRIEYKYVILEEQEWTRQASEDAEGVVSFTYRTRPEDPPDVQHIQRQMAIVAWQRGPNRYIQVPTQEELDSLQPGETREREPAKPPKTATYNPPGFGASPATPNLPLLARVARSVRLQGSEGTQEDSDLDDYEGTWERLSLAPDGVPFLERGDVWDQQEDTAKPESRTGDSMPPKS